jgi:hypothetical protein
MSAIETQISELLTSVGGYGEAVVAQQEADTTELQNQLNAVSNTVANIALVRGLFNALQLSSTGLSGAVNVTATEMVLEDTSGHLLVLKNVNVTATTGARGSAGTGANSLDTGNFASSAWYSVWVIYNETAAEAAALLSTSSTAPVLPSGYTYSTRVGWIRTDTTTQCYPLAFTQKGAQVRMKVTAGSNTAALPLIAENAAGDTTIPTWVALPVAAFVPPTTVEIAILVSATGGSCTTMVAPNNAYGPWNSTTNPPPIMWSNEGTFIFAVEELMLESGNIFWASNPGAQPPTPGGTGNTGILLCAGWTDNI